MARGQIRVQRKHLEAMLEQYAMILRWELSVTPSRTHDPDYWALRDALAQSETAGGDADSTPE